MVYGGVRDVLVTNEIVGHQKLRRLMGLASMARIGVCADDPAQIRDFRDRRRRGRDQSAGLCRDQHGRQPLRGRSRATGSRPRPAHRRRGPSELWRASRPITARPRSAHVGGAAEGDRRRGRKGGHDPRTCWSPHGIPCDAITGAGTGTFEFEVRKRGLYRNCNADRMCSWTPITARNLDRDGTPTRSFEPSLFVLGDGDEPAAAERANRPMPG